MVVFKNVPETARTQSAMSSNVRGRISAPIPLDEDFPSRKLGSAAASEADSRRIHSSAAGSSNLTSGTAPSDVIPEDDEEKTAQSGPSQTSYASGSYQNRRTMRASTVRYSVVSADSGNHPPQRKKSTLKSTLGRIFGRKKKSTSELPTINMHTRASSSPTHPTHHHTVSLHTDPYSRLTFSSRSSNNLLLQETPGHGQAFSKDTESKRSVSMPVPDYTKPIRPRSVGPDNTGAPESGPDSLQLDPDRRRATTSSRILSTGTNDTSAEMVGLTPRPASAHQKGSTPPLVPETDNPEEIGRAITSDNLAHRRRSRSLSQLQEMIGNQPGVRRRSAEIRYWRGSQDPESHQSDADGTMDEMSNIEADTHVEEPPTEMLPPSEPPPPPPTFAATTNPKSTEVATLEDRIIALEARNQKLLKLVSQLFEVVPGVEAYADPPSTANGPPPSFTLTNNSIPINSSLCRTISEDLRKPWSRQSDESFGEGHTFMGSTQLPSTTPAARPISTATLRGTVREATSLPTLSRGDTGTYIADHYTTLKALIDTEAAARQALEDQVKKLTHRVNRMSRSVTDPGVGPQRNGTFSTFEHDEEEELPTPSSAYEYSESEAYKTPREERGGPDFDAILDEDLDENFSRKRAPRTLSLGQLTLGKPSRTPSEIHSPEIGVDS